LTQVATYPDHIISSIEAEHQTGPDSHPFLLDGSIERSRFKQILKRGMDVTGSLAIILATSPIWILAALAIRLTSRGPVVFKQVRLGEGGRPFTFYKFRSMYVQADDRSHREFVGKHIDGRTDEINQGCKDGPHFKMKDDPRVTGVGKFLRSTSIDELPQLFNVLKGDMSLVGPRPPLPYEAVKYRAWHLSRLMDVQPGITGLWQVEGRSRVSFDDMVRLDIRYLREWSLVLDIRILVKTILVVLRRDGAT
jgi:exopolysaccharide biosynthesis polyprenyl glycosylphosphotransferase